MTIGRAFWYTFGASLLLTLLNRVPPESSLLTGVLGVLGYLPLFALGFILSRFDHPYRIARTYTWPFVISWFAAGLLAIHFGLDEVPPDWSAGKTRLAEWGYVLSTIIFLPLAFGASVLGVWLGRRHQRVAGDRSDVAIRLPKSRAGWAFVIVYLVLASFFVYQAFTCSGWLCDLAGIPAALPFGAIYLAVLQWLDPIYVFGSITYAPFRNWWFIIPTLIVNSLICYWLGSGIGKLCAKLFRRLPR